MKKLKQLFCLLLCVVFALPLSVTALCVQSDTASADVSAGLTADDYLSVSGRKIVNRRGEQVKLKGVNLGAWLMWEDWLCPYEGAKDHYDVLELLIERFGIQRAYELMKTYEDNFITEYDLDNIKQMGFNCVRVPFWYRNFYSDDDGTRILDANGQWDFSRLDWIVSECAERGLYVILDMHGAPGFQSDAPHSGKSDSCGLYEQTPQGERYRELTINLWTAIALRFNGNPAVAMYDLLNEPMCDVECTELKRRSNNEYIYTLLYDAVREADSEHIITLECIWTAVALPHTWVKGWKNVVYQVHFYNNSDFIFAFFLLLTRMYHPDMPLMMGEFYPLKRTTWKGCFTTLNNLNYHWLLWTYKAAGHGMWESDWCLEGSRDGFERARVDTDSYEEIARKWGECLRTENGYTDSGHYETVKHYLK